MDTLIPIKCFTCGLVIADKYLYYCEEVRKLKLLKHNEEETFKLDKVVYLTLETKDKSIEGIVLDKIGLNKLCCRRHMLTKA